MADSPYKRTGLLETFQEEGLGAGLGQMAQMFTPQSIWTGEMDLGSLARDFVEFSPIGDVKDVAAGWTGKEGSWKLDPLERTFALLPLAGWSLGATALGIGLHRLQKIRLQAAGREAMLQSARADVALRQSMQPIPGEGWDMPYQEKRTKEELSTEEGMRRTAIEGEAARAREQAPQTFMLMDTRSMNELVRYTDNRLNHEADLAVSEPVRAQHQVERRDAMSVGLDFLAQRMIGELGEGYFGRADPETGAMPSPETQKLKAAQLAVTTWLRAIETGVLDIDGMEFHEAAYMQDMSKRLQAAGDPNSTTDMRIAMDKLDEMAAVTMAVLRHGLGPNLNPTPQLRMGKIRVKNGEAKLILKAVTELLPTHRIIDRRPGQIPFLLDSENHETRMMIVDFESLVGEMTANVYRRAVEEMTDMPDRWSTAITWYVSANASARKLSEISGRSVATIATIISALSPRAPWAPGNLTAGIHLILRHSLPDLDPFSSEYKQHFIDVIDAGGWAQDLFDNSSKAVKKKIKAQYGKNWKKGIVEYWANMDNNVGAGTKWDPEKPKERAKAANPERYGEYKTAPQIRGFEMKMKQDAVMAALYTHVPHHVILRMAKTHEFQAAIDNPLLIDAGVVDVHSDHVTMGHFLGPEPLTMGETRTVTLKELRAGYKLNEATNVILREEDIELARQELYDAGWSPAQVETQIKAWRKVPSEGAERRYSVQRAAHALVRELLGLEQVNQVQSGTWVRGRDEKLQLRSNIQQFKTYGDRKALKKAAERLIWDYSIINHLEGNPQLVGGMTAQVSAVSEDLNIFLDKADVKGFEPRRARKVRVLDDDGKPAFNKNGTPKYKWVDRQKPGEGILVVPASWEQGGPVHVYAPPQLRGVRQQLRHLYPTEYRVGKYRRYLPRKPKAVRSVEEHLGEYSSQLDGEVPIVGETRVWADPGIGYAPGEAGNMFIAEVDQSRVAEVVQLIEQQPWPFDVHVQTTGVVVSRTGHSRQKVTRNMLRTMKRSLLESASGPILTHDWVAISPERFDVDPDTNYQRYLAMKEDLEAAGIDYLEASSSYEGTSERSFFCFGADYTKMLNLARKYGQESIATRNGLIFRDGEVMPPKESDVKFGFDSIDPDNHSVIDLGNGSKLAFSMPYDNEAAFGLDGPATSLMGSSKAGLESKRARIIVALGQESSPDWGKTDSLWSALDGHDSVMGLEAHIMGEMWKPPKTQRVYETVFTDPAGRIGTWRTGQDLGAHVPNQYDVYVRNQEAQALSSSGNDGASGKRSKEQAMRVAHVEDDIIHIDGDLDIVYPVDQDVKLKGSLLRGSTAVLDLNQPVPTLVMEGSGSGPGRIDVTIVKGQIVGMKAFNRNDAHQARNVLERSGHLAEDHDIYIDDEWVGEVDYDPAWSLEHDSIGRAEADMTFDPTDDASWQAQMAASDLDAETEQFLHEIWGQDPQEPAAPMELGVHAQSKHREQVVNTLGPLFGGDTGYTRIMDFVEKHGPIPLQILTGIDTNKKVTNLFPVQPPKGVTVASLQENGKLRQDIFAAVHTGVATDHGIVINEALFARDTAAGGQLLEAQRQRAGHRKWTVSGKAESLTESTLVHESGHLIEKQFRKWGLGTEFEHGVLAVVEELGGIAGVRGKVSRYASVNWGEAWAEMFAQVVLDPDAAPEPVNRFVADVMEAIQGFDPHVAAMRAKQWPRSRPPLYRNKYSSLSNFWR